MRTCRSLCGLLLLGIAPWLHAETNSFPATFAQIPELTLNMPAGSAPMVLPEAVGQAYLGAANKRAWRTEARVEQADYLVLDATPGNPYDNVGTPRAYVTYALSDAQGTRQSWFAAIQAQHSGGARVQLLVGIDTNGDGLPQASEELCRVGEELYDSQRCLLDLRGKSAGTLWAFAHVIGPFGTGYTPSDYVKVSIATADFQLSNGGTKVSVVPSSDFLFASRAKTAGASTSVDFSYRPDVAHASSDPFEAVGGLLLTAADEALSSATLWPLRVEFTPVVRAGQSYAFAPRGYAFDEVKVLLQPGETYYGLYVDNPWQDYLDVAVLDPSVSVFGWREPLPASSIDSRLAQVAPPGDTIGFNLWPGALPGAPSFLQACAYCDVKLRLDNSRIRFRLRNESSVPRQARLRVRLGLSIQLDPPPPLGLYAGSGNYYNPLRSGEGIFLDVYNQLQIFYWYTFDRNGQPIWYTASAEPSYEDGAMGTFRSTLYRIDRLSDGTRQPIPVGRVVLTRASNDGRDLILSWSIDGDSGTNRIQLATTPRCTLQTPGQQINLTGHWFDPGAPGWGTNLLGLHNEIGEGLYFFDEQGTPRWVFGSVSYNNDAWSGILYQFKGACPTCTYLAPTITPVGDARLHFSSDNEGLSSYSINLAPPLLGGFTQTSVAIHRATSAVICSNSP